MIVNAYIEYVFSVNFAPFVPVKQAPSLPYSEYFMEFDCLCPDPSLPPGPCLWDDARIGFGAF